MQSATPLGYRPTGTMGRVCQLFVFESTLRRQVLNLGEYILYTQPYVLLLLLLLCLVIPHNIDLPHRFQRLYFPAPETPLTSHTLILGRSVNFLSVQGRTLFLSFCAFVGSGVEKGPRIEITISSVKTIQYRDILDAYN